MENAILFRESGADISKRIVPSPEENIRQNTQSSSAGTLTTPPSLPSLAPDVNVLWILPSMKVENSRSGSQVNQSDMT